MVARAGLSSSLHRSRLEGLSGDGMFGTIDPQKMDQAPSVYLEMEGRVPDWRLSTLTTVGNDWVIRPHFHSSSLAMSMVWPSSEAKATVTQTV